MYLLRRDEAYVGAGNRLRHGLMTTADFDATLRGAQAGDEECFAAIWREHQPALLRYLRVMSGTAGEDLTSDTWLQVVRTLRTFSGNEQSFRGWLFTVGRNRYIDWYRRQSRRGEVIADVEALDRPSTRDDPIATVEERMSTERALALIATLPPDQAEAVMLRVIAELDVGAVAVIMGRPPGTVRVLAHRGLRRLAQQIASQTPDGPDPSKPEPEGLAV
jgi:RNA polymerase sigma-70 factor (ECF subfamily)